MRQGSASPSRLSTSFHKLGNVFLTPSHGPPRLVKAPAAGQPLPRGERVTFFDAHPPIEHNPLPSRERVPEERGPVRGVYADDGRDRIR